MNIMRRRVGAGPLPSGLTVLTIVAGLAVAVQPGVAAVKIHVDFDKAFDFRQAKTWGWHPQEAGYVRVARTPSDDPEAIRMRAEPIIMRAVSTEMPKRGLMPAASSSKPDLTITYFLLVTLGSTSQTLGQFLPSVAQWGVPPFAAVSTSYEIIEQGSLVLDASANDRIVWRGIAQAKIDLEHDQDKRAALIREAVQKILDRFPPKK
jgi:hypothetical protein